MAVSTSNLKNGMCVSHKGRLWTIVKFQHVKPGKGGAFVRTKLKEVKTGRVVDETFRAGEKLEDVRMETRRMQYLYGDGAALHVMDTDSYEQHELPLDVVGDSPKWLSEGDEIQALYAGGELIGVEPPMFVELAIAETDPGFKGDTVQGGTKPATLSTGAVIQVPMFIEPGDRVKVDTRDGSYITRV